VSEASPGIFKEIILSRVHFYNRVQFFTPVFKMLKVVLYIELLRVLSRPKISRARQEGKRPKHKCKMVNQSKFERVLESFVQYHA